MISQSVLRVRIEREAAKYESHSDAAKHFGMTRQHLSLILGGGKISDAVARKFGYRQDERYFVKLSDVTEEEMKEGTR